MEKPIKGKIIGAVLMVERPTDYELQATVKVGSTTSVHYGYGEDLRECWLDMFAKFNMQNPNTFIVNGKLKGHEIMYEDILMQ